MGRSRTEITSRDYVVDPNLERRSLFVALLGFDPSITAVLYPGSCGYETPSFCFPHVVYVDRSEFAE